MKHVLPALLLAALAACGEHEPPAAPTTELIVEVRNDDPVEYALWLEWQDNSGGWNQTFLFSLFGHPLDGPTQDFSQITVRPGIPYTVTLADPDGNVFDSMTVSLDAGMLLDLHFRIVGGFLMPT